MARTESSLLSVLELAMHYMLAGIRHARPATNPQNAPDDFPCFGAVMNFATAGGFRRSRSFDSMLPPAVSLNSPANQVSASNHIFPGFFAGFSARLTIPSSSRRMPALPIFVRFQKWIATTVSAAGSRYSRRSRVRPRRSSARWQCATSTQTTLTKAFSFLTAPAVRQAFDIAEEPVPLRDTYGRTPFGQGCLLARRLVERGVSLVTVNWERDDAYWDTHQNNFRDLRTKLCPNLDQGFSALLDDLI